MVVIAGDLFAQDDAHIAVGFTDTFDTATDHDVIISSESAQGQLVQRLYGGNNKQLDRDLRSALRHVIPDHVETRAAKHLGKLTRYPIGTVATLRQDRRRIFAVAYSRMGNDMVARSTLTNLRLSLDRLWDAVYLHGQLKPIALPLVGSDLSRIREATYEQLLILIIESFVSSSRERFLSPELRIVVSAAQIAKIEVPNVTKLVHQSLPQYVD